VRGLPKRNADWADGHMRHGQFVRMHSRAPDYCTAVAGCADPLRPCSGSLGDRCSSVQAQVQRIRISLDRVKTLIGKQQKFVETSQEFRKEAELLRDEDRSAL